MQVEDALGTDAYTRAGNFSLNSDGEVVLASDQGRRLIPIIVVPPEAMSITITNDGLVQYKLPGELEMTEAGRIETATFANPAGLRQVGENLFTATDASRNACRAHIQLPNPMASSDGGPLAAELYVVVEDSTSGVMAAQAAKMEVVGFLGGGHAQADWYREKLASYKIPLTYTDSELLKYLS